MRERVGMRGAGEIQNRLENPRFFQTRLPIIRVDPISR